MSGAWIIHSDSYYDEISYIVTWDGNELTNIKQSDGFDKVIFDNYSITSCSHNHTLFESDIGMWYNSE